jgi:hypothetical protein
MKNTFVQDPATAAWTNTTTYTNTTCVAADSETFCRQLKTAAKTLTAASALTGITMLFAIVNMVTSLMRSKSTSPVITEALRKLFLLAGVTGAGCEGFGGILAANLLVNLQYPNGDTIVDLTTNQLHGEWNIGRGCTFVAVAFILTVIGIVLAPAPGAAIDPRPDHHHEHHNHHRAEDSTFKD